MYQILLPKMFQTELADSKTDFVNVFHYLPGLYIIVSPDAPHFTISEANQSYAAATHTSREQILGKSFFEVFPDNPLNHEATGITMLLASFKYVLQHKATHKLVSQKYDIYNPEKGIFEERYWKATNIPILDKENNVTAIIHSVEDVTEQIQLKKNRKQAIKYALRQREQLLSFFEQAPVAVSILEGNDFTIEYANPKICEIWGKSMNQVLRKPLFEIIPESKTNSFVRLINNVLTTGSSFTGFEVPSRIIRDGKEETIFLNMVWSPMEGPDGDVKGVFVIASDVTEQVLIKKRIEENEQRMNLAMEVSQMGVFDYCAYSNYLSRSQKFDDIFGVHQGHEDWSFGKLRQYIHYEDRFPAIRSIAHALKTKEKISLQFRIQLQNSTIKWVELQGRIFRNEAGTVTRILGSVTDISKRKELERHKDEFMGILSHELKTPVTSLKAYTQVLEQKFSKEGDVLAASMLHKMDLQINKLTKLIVDLLDATKIEAGKLQLQTEVFDLQQLIDEVVEEVQRTSLKHKIVKENNEKVLVTGDKERIGQVITNFLTNAIKYSPAADTIRIDTAYSEGAITCSVTDYGMGIQPQYLDKVFNRFFRINENRRNMIPGLGLGMYISSEIIKRHNGSIWAESQEGNGARFCFKLPLVCKI
jgi:two-component system, OmpR family, sensor histidine kinase VicK